MTFLPRRNSFRSSRALLLIFACLLLFCTVPFSARAAAGPHSKTDSRRVWVDHQAQETLAWISSLGAVKLADYDSFSLWQIPSSVETTPDSPQKFLAAELQPVEDSIFLRGIRLEPGTDSSLSGLNNEPGPERGYWMVQFIGPVQDAWLEDLRAQGLSTAAYLPNNAYVVWGSHPRETLEDMVSRSPYIHWTGAYLPEYRLSPELRPLADSTSPAAQDPLQVTIQVITTPDTDLVINRLIEQSTALIEPPVSLAGFTTLSLQISPALLKELAAWPDIFNIETWTAPEMQDEAQGQILAGNIITDAGKTIPSGPGYLAWLDGLGFPQDPSAYPLVEVMDDGLDQGIASAVMHPDYYVLGVSPGTVRVAYMTNCTTDSLPNAVGGHGNLNAGIIAGYNNRVGFPYQDPLGYHYGLGISPYGRVAATKIFRNDSSFDLTKCSGSYSAMVSRSYSGGARITSNSWGNNAASYLGQYTAAAQVYDILTRDAAPAVPGNQQMLHIFSGGNSGSSGAGSVTSPGTAKNVISVGAAEGVRDQGVQDRCGHVNADSADDIAGFSSRGPADDGRMKPDIMAPGVHISAQASQDPAYSGKTVCGTYLNEYYPAGQTVYTWSSGTSHSAPAVSGAAQLAYEYYQRVLQPGAVPSPAMVKALLLNSTQYMTGVSANDTLPSPNQGWGRANLGRLFDGTSRYLLDQSFVFNNTGSEMLVQGGIIDSSKPFRVTLVWTDAPGATAGSAYVNNLDLEVTVGQQVYKGNVFSGAASITGGSFDAVNNVESVFLPEGLTGVWQVRVVARNIAGDAIFDNGDATDQDFALVIYNGSTTLAPSLTFSGMQWKNATELYDIPGVALPGDTIDLYLNLTNQGNLNSTQITGTLSLNSGQAALLAATSTYPDIAPGSTAANLVPFKLRIFPDQTCGQAPQLTLTLQYAPEIQKVFPISLPVGAFWSEQIAYTGSPVSIPDNLPAGVTLVASRPTGAFAGQIADINAQISITHPHAADLGISLVSPEGSTVMLSSDNGGSGANYQGTIFDDTASALISDGSAPFPGSYRPEQALTALNRQSASGDWQLNVVDALAGNTGQVQSFSLDFQLFTCDKHSPLLARKTFLPLISLPPAP